MKVTDYLDKLARGMLSNLSISENNQISPKAIEGVVDVINEGLLELYGRFVLKENILTLLTVENISIYEIDPCRAVSNVECNPEKFKEYGFNDSYKLKEGNSLEDLSYNAVFTGKYILDSEFAPFIGDYIKPISIIDEHQNPIPINDLSHPNSIFTPTPNTIQVPRPLVGKLLSIEYQASHPKLVAPNFRNSCESNKAQIELPSVLFRLLDLYVGSRILGQMNTQENTSKSLEYLAEYKRACNDLIFNDTIGISRAYSGHKFNIRGWV